jgi:hypothetical protein
MRARTLSSLAMVAAVAGLAGCAAREVPITEVAGGCADVFGGQVCTWARMQGDKVVDVGATIPIASIEGAPPDAVVASTGMRELTIYWEAMGHPPGPYLTPHWDFHFYTIPTAERMAIDCVDLSKPAAMPEGFALPDIPLPPEMQAMFGGVKELTGLCVPQMGMHSLLATEMASTTPFRGTMVVGYTKGKPIFVEPMITKAMLMEKASFDLAMPAVPGMTPAPPRTFRAEWDAQANAYRFTFSGFGAAN